MAHFRTGYQQYVLPVDATVAVDLVVGDLGRYNQCVVMFLSRYGL